jgi:hypothetical protein
MVKRALSIGVLVCCFGALVATAAAVEQPAPPGATAAAPAEIQVAPPPADSDGPAAVDQRRGKGSGFWTSDVPTEDRPYRWTYMIIGLCVVALMGVLVLVVIRRNAGTGSERGPAAKR